MFALLRFCKDVLLLSNRNPLAIWENILTCNQIYSKIFLNDTESKVEDTVHILWVNYNGENARRDEEEEGEHVVMYVVCILAWFIQRNQKNRQNQTYTQERLYKQSPREQDTNLEVTAEL